MILAHIFIWSVVDTSVTSTPCVVADFVFRGVLSSLEIFGIKYTLILKLHYPAHSLLFCYIMYKVPLRF